MPRAAVALARVIHVVSASWVLVLGFIILVDVIGRAAFSTPFLGATEIIKNSIVAVTFLQIPLAIFSGSMIRTEILADSLPFVLRRLLRTLVYLLGAAFFALIVIASWSDAVRGFEIGEYEG